METASQLYPSINQVMMNMNNNFLYRFFNYIYKGEIEVTARLIESYTTDIETIQEGEPIEDNQQLSSSTSATTARKKILGDHVLIINIVLTIVCIGSFIAIIVYVFVYPDKPIPDIMQNAFWTTLGWFGSAFVNFFHIDQEN